MNHTQAEEWRLGEVDGKSPGRYGQEDQATLRNKRAQSIADRVKGVAAGVE